MKSWLKNFLTLYDKFSQSESNKWITQAWKADSGSLVVRQLPSTLVTWVWLASTFGYIFGHPVHFEMCGWDKVSLAVWNTQGFYKVLRSLKKSKIWKLVFRALQSLKFWSKVFWKSYESLKYSWRFVFSNPSHKLESKVFSLCQFRPLESG